MCVVNPCLIPIFAIMNAKIGRKIILQVIKDKGMSIEDASVKIGFKNREGLYRMLKHPRKMRYEQAQSLAAVTRLPIRKIFKIYGLHI